MYIRSFRRGSDRDVADDDQRGCLLVVAGSILLAVSAFLASREIVYLCCGRDAQATLLRLYDTRGRDPGTTVDFEFLDAGSGQQRRHSDQLRLGWRPPPGPLAIEYVPGWETFARVAGHTQQWSLWVFGAALTLAIVYIGLLIREAGAPIRRQRKM